MENVAQPAIIVVKVASQIVILVLLLPFQILVNVLLDYAAANGATVEPQQTIVILPKDVKVLIAGQTQTPPLLQNAEDLSNVQMALVVVPRGNVEPQHPIVARVASLIVSLPLQNVVVLLLAQTVHAVLKMVSVDGQQPFVPQVASQTVGMETIVEVEEAIPATNPSK